MVPPDFEIEPHEAYKILTYCTLWLIWHSKQIFYLKLWLDIENNEKWVTGSEFAVCLSLAIGDLSKQESCNDLFLLGKPECSGGTLSLQPLCLLIFGSLQSHTFW